MPDKTTLSGKPAADPDNPAAPAPIDYVTGQRKDYWVLTEEERAKGFVRPVRFSYRHKTCNAITKMTAPALAETFARDPSFYSHTFCVGCGKHLPVSEFVWQDTSEDVGS